MKDEVKVGFYLKKNEGVMCPVMVRLTIGKSQAVFSAKLKVKAEMWAAGRVKGKSKEAGAVNRQLDELRASALASHKELSATRVRVTADEVKSRMLGMASGQETLLAYFRTHNEKFEQRVGVNRSAGMAYSYCHALKHVEKFIQEKLHLTDIPFSALDRSFIDRYALHLKIDCGLSAGSIVVQTVRLGTIINKAISDGIITANPFAGYELARPVRKPKYLTDDEVDRLMNMPLKSVKHALIRDLFLFSCHTGIPYGDMCTLSEKDLWISEDGTTWIKSRRGKTDVEYQMPLLELPLKILEKYRGIAPVGRLLPMSGNSSMNEIIKAVARECGITRPVSWHAARHTFGTHAVSHGVPIETVSKMLGHSRITTTQIYAKITDEKIDEDMRSLEKKISERFKFAV